MALETSLRQRPYIPSPRLSRPVKSSSDNLLNTILTNWIDGILILTKDGHWVKSNQIAQEICDRITQEQPDIGQIPKEIWRACQVLIQSRQDYPDYSVIAESELSLNTHEHFRIRARWFTFGEDAEPHILVILEDQIHSKQNLAITEVDRYNLSPREAEVWLLHRSGYAYREIASELYIAINTVKRHVKNIYAKRQLALVVEKCDTYIHSA